MGEKLGENEKKKGTELLLRTVSTPDGNLAVDGSVGRVGLWVERDTDAVERQKTVSVFFGARSALSKAILAGLSATWGIRLSANEHCGEVEMTYGALLLGDGLVVVRNGLGVLGVIGMVAGNVVVRGAVAQLPVVNDAGLNGQLERLDGVDSLVLGQASRLNGPGLHVLSLGRLATSTALLGSLLLLGSPQSLNVHLFVGARK